MENANGNDGSSESGKSAIVEATIVSSGANIDDRASNIESGTTSKVDVEDMTVR